MSTSVLQLDRTKKDGLRTRISPGVAFVGLSQQDGSGTICKLPAVSKLVVSEYKTWYFCAARLSAAP